MAIQHSAITDPEIHEPKGASAASVDTVYVSDGVGSGVWQKIEADQLDQADVETYLQNALDTGDLDVNGVFYLYATIADVSTPSDILIPIIDDCTFVSARMVLNGTIATADASVTFVNAAAASMGSAVTIVASGSGEGTGFTFTAAGNNVFTAPTWFKIATDGASDNAIPLHIILKFTAVLNP